MSAYPTRIVCLTEETTETLYLLGEGHRVVEEWDDPLISGFRWVEELGWSTTPAVRSGHIYEIKSTYILQPGPASLTEGVHQMHRIIAAAARGVAGERLRA